MSIISADEIRARWAEPFKRYLAEGWAQEWRDNYIAQVKRVAAAEREQWCDRNFQEMLWDSNAVSSIGPGQSVTVREAYTDRVLAEKLFDARSTLADQPVEERGNRLQKLYDEVLTHIYPRYTPRRPKARLARLLAAMFPQDMTCLMDAGRVWGIERALGSQRVVGDFIAQNPGIRALLRDVLGEPSTDGDAVDQSIFTWYLWQTVVDQPDEGAVAVQAPQREANAVPPFSLLPANAQRRGLPSVQNNISLLVSMVREAEQGISREDLVSVILAEATQLNASSAGNMLSQAMGGLGLLRLEDGAYRPTDRGLDLLAAADPAEVLRAPLIGRVFGFGHLLLIVRREKGVLRATDAAARLQALVPTWKSNQPGSYIISWARLVGLVELDSNPSGGRLILTDDGEDYAAALPDDFEQKWSFPPAHPADDEEAGDKFVGSPLSSDYDLQTLIADGCFLPPSQLKTMIELLRRKKNLILQGPPGTGKTWLAKRLGYALIGAKDPDRLTAVQFQPSLSYEDFVRGWRPDGTGGLTLADGAFLEAVNAALSETERPYVLVIEEINRGNPAQVLGELLTLIEDSKRDPSEALRLAYPRTIDERVHVPPNLHIIGTMNLADRSLALVDLALRRRFAFINLNPALGPLWRKWCLEHGMPSAVIDVIAERLGDLNKLIGADRALGTQFQVGHSFVTPISKTAPPSGWPAWYNEVVETEIGPLLAEYWYDNSAQAQSQIAKLRIGE